MPEINEKKDLEGSFLNAYEEYHNAIFRHCYFRVFSRDRALELTQDTFMKVWEYLSDGKKVENIRAFLYRVATNLIIDESRKRKVRKETSLDVLQEKGFDPGKDDSDQMEDVVEGKRLLKIIDEVDEKYRDVIIMRFIDNLTPQEISEITGESANTVSVRIHRGIKRVQKILEDEQNGK